MPFFLCMVVFCPLAFFKALKSAPVILFLSPAALAIFFCFGVNDLAIIFYRLFSSCRRPYSLALNSHSHRICTWLFSFLISGFLFCLSKLFICCSQSFHTVFVFWFHTSAGSAHYLLTFFLAVGFDFGTLPERSGTQLGTFLPFFIFMPTWV